ncbi:MAG TPA: FIST N-terminal domain-containing protein [Kofleriaceae bacterium]|nr:FIST N-terminal domain-containing protein [Kofleriaceae bacterium]
MLAVQRGSSRRRDVAEAVAELAGAIRDPSAALALVFASPEYDSDRVAALTAEALAPTPVWGCTTAGEIGADGFSRGGMVGLTLASPRLRVAGGLADGLRRSPFSSGSHATAAALDGLGLDRAALHPRRQVALTLIDGRSGQEESFIAGAAAGAPSVRFVGGSASDVIGGPPVARVFAGGRAHADAGLVLMFDTDLPFAVIKSEHMVPTDERVVVTRIQPGARVVHELDGKPAAQVYARLIGAGTDIPLGLSARHPFAYYLGGQPYVRSVISAEGESLRFACAVERGVVLRLMRPGELIETTRRDLEAATREVEPVAALIAFNCMGRFLESEATGQTAAVGEVLTRYPVVGFNTLGEQFNALHVNHTLTALAFGVGHG